MKFTIILCTRNRPQMLSNCIRSIQKLTIPSNCQLHLVVAENNANPDCEQLIKDLMKSTPSLDYTYILETKLGLPMVRNTSVETAIETNPDWIWFLDDDQIVGSELLTIYNEVIQSQAADVFTGPVNYILPENIRPENLPIWFKYPIPRHDHSHLKSLDSAGAGNTIAKSSFFNGQQHEFRFKEKFRFTGGEDTDLFSRIKYSGGIIRYVKDAVVDEVCRFGEIKFKVVDSKRIF